MRPALQAFADAMEAKLRKNDAAKGVYGWQDMAPSEIRDRIHDELAELDAAVDCLALERMLDECVDIANFAMMLHDNLAPDVQEPVPSQDQAPIKQTIWKFPLEITTEQTITIPAGFTPLHVAVQEPGSVPCLWCLVYPQQPNIKQKILTYGTGESLPEITTNDGGYSGELTDHYIGTYMMNGGAFVAHVFWGQREE